MRPAEWRSPGSFRQRELLPAVDVDQGEVVDLANAGHRERRLLRARACISRIWPSGLTCTGGQRRRAKGLSRALLDGVCCGSGPAPREFDRGTPIRDTRELAAGGRGGSEGMPQVDGRAQSRRSLAERGRYSAARYRAVHQHVDVATHQPGGGEQDEDGDEERRDRVAVRMTGPHEQETDEVRQIEPARLSPAGEVEGATRGRGARRCWTRHGRCSARRRSRSRPRSSRRRTRRYAYRAAGDEEPLAHARRPIRGARQQEKRSSGERRQVLGLAVTVLVRDVRRRPGHTVARNVSSAATRSVPE